MTKLSAAMRRILEFTTNEMEKKALEGFGDLAEDGELGRADWPTVKSYMKVLNSNLYGERVVHRHDASNSGGNSEPMISKDIRVRFLNGVQAACWVMLEEGRISQNTANILMRSVDEALDLVAHEPLCDWKGLKHNVQFPYCYKFLQGSMCPQKLATFLAAKRLESACYICAAFLQAHRIARQQLLDFIGDNEIASAAINESEAEGGEARNFLDDVRITFPEILRVLKTSQVTRSSLKQLNDYIQSLDNAGMLEEKEVLQLQEAVKADLKKFLRNPPSVKVRKVGDLVNTHPLLGALIPVQNSDQH